jgi:hypothetical protein
MKFIAYIAATAGLVGTCHSQGTLLADLPLDLLPAYYRLLNVCVSGGTNSANFPLYDP